MTNRFCSRQIGKCPTAYDGTNHQCQYCQLTRLAHHHRFTDTGQEHKLPIALSLAACQTRSGYGHDFLFCKNRVDQTVKTPGGIDILVPVAGQQHALEDIADLAAEPFKATLRTNVLAIFWLCKAALPHMRVSATIIHARSLQRYPPSPILPGCASTKAAIAAFTHLLAKPVAGKGMRVHAVAPGPRWTPLPLSGGPPQEQRIKFGAHVARQRPGQPAQPGPIDKLCATQKASCVTGEIDGVTGANHLP